MRLERVTVSGLLQADQPITLDLRDVPPGLVAVVGENGAGKTTLVEAPLAALYRTFPSRGARELVDYASGRDAFVEAVFAVDGRGTYRARVNLDGVKRTADAVLEHRGPGDGAPVLLNDGKLRTFDEAVRRHFPPLPVLLASAVASQNRAGSFVALDRRGRKELFAQLLGLDRYDAMASTARAAHGLVDQACGRLRAAADVLQRDADPARRTAIDAAIELTRDQLAAAQRDQRATEASRQAAIDQRPGLNDTALQHRAALTRRRELATEAAAVMVRHEGLGRQLAAARQAHDREVETIAGNLRAVRTDKANRIANNRRLIDAGGAITAAAARLSGLRTALEAARAENAAQRARRPEVDAGVREAEQAVHAARQAATALARDRRDAALLKNVPCGGQGAFAACGFLRNATEAAGRLPGLQASAEQLPELEALLAARRADLAALAEAEAAADRRFDELQAELREAETVAGRQPQLDAAVDRIRELEADIAGAEAQAAELTRLAGERLQATVATLTADQAAALARFDQIGELTRQADAEVEATKDAAGRLADLDATIEQAGRNLEAFARATAMLEARLDELARERARLEAAADEHKAIMGRRRRLEIEAGEWAILAKAFGRDGLPLLEIDAAGPTVSALVNDLLASCFGPRFSVELITEAAKADGKGTKDTFELRVIDNARGGAARDLADLSGGEQILVDEAMKSGLALYLNGRQPGAIQTCWRDETTGPLDGENAIRYVQMLRRVQQLGGFRHTIFVTHNPAAAQLADAQARLAGGRLTLAFPPFAAAID